jgi:hypothetical protein
MAKKQSRRSVSLSRTTYERLRTFCETNGISMSQFVEGRIGDFLGRSSASGAPAVRPPAPAPTVRPSAPAPSAQAQPAAAAPAAPMPKAAPTVIRSAPMRGAPDREKAAGKTSDEVIAKRAAANIFTF